MSPLLFPTSDWVFTGCKLFIWIKFLLFHTPDWRLLLTLDWWQQTFWYLVSAARGFFFFWLFSKRNWWDLRSKAHKRAKTFLKMQLPGVSKLPFMCVYQQLLLQVSIYCLWLSEFTCLSRFGVIICPETQLYYGSMKVTYF